jgi:hypothetical protein
LLVRLEGLKMLQPGSYDYKEPNWNSMGSRYLPKTHWYGKLEYIDVLKYLVLFADSLAMRLRVEACTMGNFFLKSFLFFYFQRLLNNPVSPAPSPQIKITRSSKSEISILKES